MELNQNADALFEAREALVRAEQHRIRTRYPRASRHRIHHTDEEGVLHSQLYAF